MSNSSDHPLTNKAATAEFLRIQNLLSDQIAQVTALIDATKTLTATTSSKGMTQLTTSNNITDANIYALSGIEKNAAVGGTLAANIAHESSRVSYVDNRITGVDNRVTSCYNDLSLHGIFAQATYTNFSSIPMYGDFRHVTVHYTGSDPKAPITTSDLDWWWEVLAFGSLSRGTQIAFSVFRDRHRMWIRQCHDNYWYGWYKFTSSDNIT